VIFFVDLCGIVLNTLRQRESSRVNPWLNEQLGGAAVCGTVTATSSARSKLSLETDGVTESAAIETAGEAGKYIYRGKDVSSGLKVSVKILDEAGNVISISKSIDLAELAKLTGHSVEELTDILKHLGMNADELACLLKGGTLYDILGVSPAKIINSIPYNSYDEMKAAFKGTWTAWSNANKPLGSPQYLLDTFEMSGIPKGYILHHEIANGAFQLVTALAIPPFGASSNNAPLEGQT